MQIGDVFIVDSPDGKPLSQKFVATNMYAITEAYDRIYHGDTYIVIAGMSVSGIYFKTQFFPSGQVLFLLTNELEYLIHNQTILPTNK